MTEYIKYQHVEKIDSTETEGLLDGRCYIYPKLDGSNAHVWASVNHKDGNDTNTIKLHFGSRNRELSLESDNAGFMNQFHQNERLIEFFKEYPHFRLFGEFLVPHSLKTYRDDAWRRFWIFDVYNRDSEEPHRALPYEVYKPILDQYELDYVVPIQILNNPTSESLYNALNRNTFLIKDNEGLGEGIVVKNFDFVNRYGRQTWGKLVTNQFKEIHHREMGAPEVNATALLEDKIVSEFVTTDFVMKEKNKIETSEGWTSKQIPHLLGVVFYELIRENMWDILKKHKNPEINFQLLQRLTIKKTKEIIGV